MPLQRSLRMAGLARRFQKAPGIAQSGVYDDPTHAATKKLQAALLGSVLDGFCRPENLGCSPQDPGTTGAPVSDEKYLRDIKTQPHRLPGPRQVPWLEGNSVTAPWLTGSRQSSMGRWN